jgi:hypothetical protein
MTRAESAFLTLATALVAGSGLVYGWMAYFATSDDPDALVNHPLQPDVQHAHVLVAPLFVFALGLVWRSHVWARVRSGHRERRTTGLALFALVAPMTASGYLLQTSIDPDRRSIWVAIHVATSLAFVAGFLAHRIASRTMRVRATSAVAGVLAEPALDERQQGRGRELVSARRHVEVVVPVRR